ncbi:dihydropteroate synthase [Prosthecobacter sp.]|uniref:dihydropteroate synthase n=1 Tax=Prosthecobacter sp. TaxID=1965333 RepID=UPI0025F84735|nr:dihydropteroate synthase [Prosthecobacter sp.]
MIWKARQHTIEFPRRPLVMGIVNINDDSFCGDGTLDPTAALAQAEQQLNEGADIIDIGAESARTNREAISANEEVDRLRPFMAKWPELKARFNAPLLSINTWRSDVIAEVLPLGGDLINDISGLPDAFNAKLCAEHNAGLLIMHSVGQPKVPHTHVQYPSIMDTLDRFFEQRLVMAESVGLPRENIILDPGIDFAKQRDDNLTIYRELEKLQRFGRPILLPVSRKTVIGDVLGVPALERDPGTVACIAAGVSRGAQIFRVHNVKAAVQAVKMLWAIESVR